MIAGVVTYTGLATGALLWGCVSDRVGRRRTLLTALTVAAIFDLMAAIMPSFGTFLTARLLGGIGYDITRAIFCPNLGFLIFQNFGFALFFVFLFFCFVLRSTLQQHSLTRVRRIQKKKKVYILV